MNDSAGKNIVLAVSVLELRAETYRGDTTKIEAIIFLG